MKAKLITQDVINNIVELYHSGLRIYQISKNLSIKANKISKILKENGVKVQIGGYNTNNKIKHDYFENWSHDMAWILGFTMADGYVINTDKTHLAGFRLSCKDRCILEFIKSEICPESKIYKTKAYLKKTNKYYDGLELRVHSKKIIEDLIKLQVIPNKTGKECIPDSMPDEYLPSFIRGFFDGDGSFGLYFYGKATIRNFQITGLSLILFKDLLKIFPGLIIRKRSGCYDIKINNYDLIKRIGEYIYSSPGYFLERKKNVFEQILLHPKKKTGPPFRGGRKPRKRKKQLQAA